MLGMQTREKSLVGNIINGGKNSRQLSTAALSDRGAQISFVLFFYFFLFFLIRTVLFFVSPVNFDCAAITQARVEPWLRTRTRLLPVARSFHVNRLSFDALGEPGKILLGCKYIRGGWKYVVRSRRLSCGSREGEVVVRSCFGIPMVC